LITILTIQWSDGLSLKWHGFAFMDFNFCYIEYQPTIWRLIVRLEVILDSLNRLGSQGQVISKVIGEKHIYMDVGANCMCIARAVLSLKDQAYRQKQLVWAHFHHKKYEALVAKKTT
jgi:hypothetical protein